MTLEQTACEGELRIGGHSGKMLFRSWMFIISSCSYDLDKALVYFPGLELNGTVLHIGLHIILLKAYGKCAAHVSVVKIYSRN